MRPPIIVTLLDLLQVVNECTTSDTEAVATVVYLINSGKVLLCGNFAGARIDLSPSVGVLPWSSYFVNLRQGIAGSSPQ
jgi:hypothetical protein